MRQLNRVADARSLSAERLASGMRINRASDDAAGLAIASSLDADTRVFAQGLRNVNDGLSMFNIADGALRALGNVITRITELAEQSATGTFSDAQRRALDSEARQLMREYNRIVDSTEFNGRAILTGSDDGLSLQVGGTSLQLDASSATTQLAGDGTFKAAQTVATGNTPDVTSYRNSVDVVKTADLNGDRIADVIVAATASNALYIHYGRGDGTLSAGISLNALAPNGVEIADFDGDGLLDIAAPSSVQSSATIQVYLNNGDGSFKGIAPFLGATPNPAAVQINGLTSGDVNNDGIIDLVSSSPGFQVMLGNGDGTFRSFQTYGYPAPFDSHTAIRLADFNGDGKLDVAQTNDNAQAVQIYFGNGDGSFKAATASVAATRDGFRTVDINGDGRIDIVSAYPDGSQVVVALGHGDGTFSPEVRYAAAGPALDIEVRDMNGDGFLDAVTANTNATFSLLLGNGDGSFKAPAILAATSAGYGIALDDMNEDGVLDIVSVTQNDRVAVHVQNTLMSSKLTEVDLSTRSAALDTLDHMRRVGTNLSAGLAVIGASQSRLETVASTLATARAEYSAARGRIVNTDIATESAEQVRLGILQQSAAAVLGQANLQPDIALKLLR